MKKANNRPPRAANNAANKINEAEDIKIVGIIKQNELATVYLGKGTEIIQLGAPARELSDTIYLGIFSKFGKKLIIYPDTPGVFPRTIIQGNQVFLTKINAKRFEPDELAIKIETTEDTVIEVVETIHYNFTVYTVLNDNKMTHVSDNQVVKYINPNTRKVKAIIKGLEDNYIDFGLVKLFTDDPNYLPMARDFQDEYILSRKAKEIEIIELDNPFFGFMDNKRYVAFVFSLPLFLYSLADFGRYASPKYFTIAVRQASIASLERLTASVRWVSR